MSVQMMSFKSFAYIREGLTKTMLLRQCTEFFSQSVMSYFETKLPFDEGLRMVKSWIELNELSYCARYKSETFEDLAKLFGEEEHSGEEMRPMQLLKLLQAVLYQIEEKTIEEVKPLSPQQKEDLELLRKWERELMTSIVSNLEEWKKAAWDFD
jgi:hypothetical protein